VLLVALPMRVMTMVFPSPIPAVTRPVAYFQQYRAKRKAAAAPGDESFTASTVDDRAEFSGILCRHWDDAASILEHWQRYCKAFFSAAKACAYCGSVVYGGKYSMHAGECSTVFPCCSVNVHDGEFST
jgi:hypothetical protein